MPEGRPATAILMLSHVLNDEVIALFDDVRRECQPGYRVVFLADNTRGVFRSHEDDRAFSLFRLDELQSLGYPGKSAIARRPADRANDPHHRDFNFVPGSTDLPLLHWFRQNPDYDHYWVIEYDVRYTGSWRRFFDGFEANDADLLTTTLTRYRDVPDFYYWPSLDLKDETIKREDYIRGFFPIYRISNRALTHLDGEYRRGVGGHYEGVVPTVLHKAGLSIEDIGGDGEFVRPENRNRYYRNTPAGEFLSPGTFVFRPMKLRAGKEPDTLWHPVKSVDSGKLKLRDVIEHFGQ